MAKTTKQFYITTAIPYINARPHLGHVLEWFQADTIARYHRLLGEDVAFTCGTDENSLKNVRAAEKIGQDPQAWLDEYAGIFEQIFKDLEISLTHFRRGSDQKLHWPGVQALWKKCAASGDLYKKTYTGLYCVGCELFYTPDELVDGKCPEHLTAPEEVSEENYFFRLSKYQDQILKLLKSDRVHVISDQYKNEMISFVERGLEDFSVSRSLSRARGVGVPVPDDNNHVMYVWFDALSIYITAIGFDFDQKTFETYWPADVHVIGKGIARFHAVYWLGMLLSAGLELPKAISIHGYLTSEGQKMSKSLGNVVDPVELIEKYGREPVRYYLLKEIPTHSDGDFSQERFREVYTADLANGLGNLCSRLAKLANQTGLSWPTKEAAWNPEFRKLIDSFDTSLALHWVADQVRQTDAFLSEQKPWTLTGEAKKKSISGGLVQLQSILHHLQPFLPDTTQKILTHFKNHLDQPLPPLFPRLS